MPRPAYDHIENTLLETCKDLFLHKGIRDTEMQEIANRAGISRSTLYRYMADKDELAFRVATDLLVDVINHCLADAKEPDQNGLEKLRRFSRELAREVTERPGLARFLEEMDILYGAYQSDRPEVKLYVESMEKLMHRQAQFLFEGLADGSIRSIEEPMRFAAILSHTIFSLAKSSTMSGLLRDTSYAATDLAEIHRAIDFMLNSVRA